MTFVVRKGSWFLVAHSTPTLCQRGLVEGVLSDIQKTRIHYLLPRGPSLSPPEVGEEVGTELQPQSVWRQQQASVGNHTVTAAPMGCRSSYPHPNNPERPGCDWSQLSNRRHREGRWLVHGYTAGTRQIKHKCL